MAKIILNLKKYEKLIEESNRPLLKFKREFESLVNDKKKLEKSNIELLNILKNKNQKIKKFKISNAELLQKVFDRNDEIERWESDLKKVRKLNLDLIQKRNELNNLKSTWYVKLFHQEKKSPNKIDPDVKIFSTIKWAKIYSKKHIEPKIKDDIYIKAESSKGNPHVYIEKNADENKLGKIQKQINIPKYKIKKIIWMGLDKKASHLGGFIPEIEKPLFTITILEKSFLLSHDLNNENQLKKGEIYLSYGSMIQAQESAQAILKKYIYRFLEG